jgi:hypothetical protein
MTYCPYFQIVVSWIWKSAEPLQTMAPAGKVSRSHTPRASVALGAVPDGRLPGLGTLRNVGCVVKAPTP